MSFAISNELQQGWDISVVSYVAKAEVADSAETYSTASLPKMDVSLASHRI